MDKIGHNNKMILSKKNFILFIFFVFFCFILFFPKASLAIDKTPVYCTLNNCGESETVECGYKYKKYCETCYHTCTDPETGEEYKCDPYPCCPCCTQYRCRGTWTQYKASSEDCAPTIKRRICRSVCSRDGSRCCSCGGCKIECGVWEDHTWKVGGTETCEECKSWQKAVTDSCENPDSTAWCETKPKCECCGECIDKPRSPPSYYQDLSGSAPKANPDNIYLPVKLDWEDVRGFWGGWSGGGSNIQEYAECQRGYIDFCWEEAKALNPGYNCHGEIVDEYLTCLRRETKENCESLLQDEGCEKRCPALEDGDIECYNPNEFVKYYQIKIEGDLRGCDSEDIESYSAFLEVSEFLPPCPCFYKSNRAYDWKVRGCCDKNESTCGPWSDTWQFYTNPAPEPKSPYDPDWAGPGKAENVPKEEIDTLKWCEINDQKFYEGFFVEEKYYYHPSYYKLYVYYSTEDRCHPNLMGKETAPGECPPFLLKAYPGQKNPPFKFSDPAHTSFTKLTPYAWKIAACNVGGLPCTDYSQLWRFESEDFTLPKPEVDLPPSNKVVPVSLPVKISWGSPYGMSFRYRVINDNTNAVATQGKTVDSNLVLHYPQLDLDTVYRWQIKPCWDYEAENCEDFWSDIFYFRTGYPSTLIYPEPNATEVPIPVKFDWQDVPGTNSYRLKIQGNGLDLEKIMEGVSEVILGYPDLHQETEYTWQVEICAKSGGRDCGASSEIRKFKTFKLKAPVNPKPRDGSIISTTGSHYFSWDEILGAKYYQFQITYSKAAEGEEKECLEKEGDKTTKIVSENSIYYPLKCNGQYQWQVKGCLDQKCDEKSAGDWNYWTFTLVSKKVIQEVSEEMLREVLINEVYPQIFKNIPQEASERVAEIVGDDKVAEKVLEVTKEMPDKLLNGILAGISEEILKISGPEEVPAMLEEIFNEEWEKASNRVIAKASTMPEIPEGVLRGVLASMRDEVFEKILEKVSKEIPGIPAKVEARKGGLVPCGRTSDNPDTPWNETEKCGIKHIFIMLKVIVDFLLFRFAPICLVLLALASGVLFYFSIKMEAANPITKVKRLWKAAGIGFGILLFAWLMISIIFNLIGYPFGPWWRF